jgi:hypothetical protein
LIVWPVSSLMMAAARDGERFGPGQTVGRAGVSLRVGQCGRRYRGDVFGVDEGLCTVPGGHEDGSIDRLKERLAEVLHEPRGTQDGVPNPLATEQVEFDASGSDLVRRVFHAVGAEEGHVLDSRGLCFIEKCRDVLGEIETHDGSHQVDATNAVEGRAVAVAPAPVEGDVSAGTPGGADRQAAVDEGGNDAGAGLAGRTEYECEWVMFGHDYIYR